MQFILWSALQRTAGLQKKTGLSWEFHSGKIKTRLSLPKAGGGWLEIGAYYSFSILVQVRLKRSGTRVTLSDILWNKQAYHLCCDPGPLLQSPTVRGWLEAAGEQGAGYRPCGCRHDDKDLLWEALTSSSGYAHRTGSGHGSLGNLGLVTPRFLLLLFGND